MNLSELTLECLMACQDDQSGLDDRDAKTVTKMAKLFEEYEIYDLKELKQALMDSSSIRLYD